MIRSLEDLRNYAILARDDEIGKVSDFFFDDLAWVVRYVVADTGGWLEDRQVLLSPLVLGQPDWEAQAVPVNLTRRQVEGSPPIAADLPVSRQMEVDLAEYYGWPPYWQTTPPMTGVGAMAAGPAPPEGSAGARPETGDPHLRSVEEVTGYHIQARDGSIGHVEDLIAKDENWVIRYLVVDTRNLLPGKKVLVSPAWVEDVNWVERLVHVDLLQETIKNSPEFDPSAPVNREYEVQLYDYYGRPKYWV